MGILKVFLIAMMWGPASWGEITKQTDYGQEEVDYCSVGDLAALDTFMSEKLVESKSRELGLGVELTTAPGIIGAISVEAVNFLGCEKITFTYYKTVGFPEVKFSFFQLLAGIDYKILGADVKDLFDGVVSLDKKDLRNDYKSSAIGEAPPDDSTSQEMPPGYPWPTPVDPENLNPGEFVNI